MAKKPNKKTKKLLSVRKKTQEESKKEKKDNEVVDVMKKTKISVVGEDKPSPTRFTSIRVIGIGGGGGSIVSEIASGLSRVSFVAANTDLQALQIINKKVSRFPFGQKLTKGLGTGMNVEIGKEAAQNEREGIKKLCQDQDLCIIVASLGGGTGSGAASIFAKTSKSLGNLTYGIFTLPFEFEGERKMEIAKEALKNIKGNLDVITIIPNERVFKIIDKATPLRQALSIINKNLAQGLEGLIETIYEPGLINIDFADFKTVFKNKGKIAYLNTIETSTKEGSVKDLMAQVLNSPLYPYNIQGAKGVLFNISGEKNLSLLEVSEISKNISDLVSPEAKIIFGTRILANKKRQVPIIKTTLLAIGCGEKEIKRNEIVEKEDEIKKEDKIKIVKKSEIKKSKKKTVTKIKLNITDNELSETNEKPVETDDKRIRKSGLQVKKDTQEFEKEILEKEKFWETPAYLRRKSIK